MRRQDWAKAAGVGALTALVIAVKDLSEGPLVEPWVYAAIGVATAALVAAAAALADRGRRRREREFAEVARKHGWKHHTQLEDGLFAHARRCLPFRRGHSAAAANALEGWHDGTGFLLMDASYVTGHGKGRQVHPVSALALQMPFDFALTIEKETLGHKLGDALGGEDIDVESHEFSRRFWVQSPDRRKAYDILHARALEFLLAAGQEWTWHWDGKTLFMAREGPLQPADCLTILGQGLAFRRLLPRHLLVANAPGPAGPARRS